MANPKNESRCAVVNIKVHDPLGKEVETACFKIVSDLDKLWERVQLFELNTPSLAEYIETTILSNAEYDRILS